MKRILSLVMIFLLTAFSHTAFAEDEILFATVDEVLLPDTYITPSASLFSEQKSFDDVLLDGWKNLSEEIDISNYGVSRDDIGVLYRGILFKNPKLYYVSSGFGYSYNSKYDIVTSVIPKYLETDTAVIAKTFEEIDSATDEIMLTLDESMTDFEKIMTVHDYMVLHYEYDFTYSNYDITIMNTKKGVCMAYALAFKHLMNELDIECLYVSSHEEMNHAWNLVKLDGKWYHIDLTWDDPGTNFGQVSHKYAFLSDDEIQKLPEPHYGYDLQGESADSNKYDGAEWHEGIGAIVTIGEIYYYIDNDNLVDQNGKIIFEKLDGGDGKWSVGGGFYIPDENFTGLAEYNGKLYFNTENAVYSYNPEKDITEKILDHAGICGLFIDRNTLEYSSYDILTSRFVEAGRHLLGKIRFGGTFHKNNKIIKRIYKEADADDVIVYAFCGDCTQMATITEEGTSIVSFDFKETQTLFYWDKLMKPLKDKEVYNK